MAEYFIKITLTMHCVIWFESLYEKICSLDYWLVSIVMVIEAEWQLEIEINGKTDFEIFEICGI